MLVHFGIERDDLADTLKQSLAQNRLVILVDNAGRVPEAALATMASLKDKLGQRLTYVFGGEPGTADTVGEGGLAVADTWCCRPWTAATSLPWRTTLRPVPGRGRGGSPARRE